MRINEGSKALDGMLKERVIRIDMKASIHSGGSVVLKTNVNDQSFLS